MLSKDSSFQCRINCAPKVILHEAVMVIVASICLPWGFHKDPKGTPASSPRFQPHPATGKCSSSLLSGQGKSSFNLLSWLMYYCSLPSSVTVSDCGPSALQERERNVLMYFAMCLPCFNSWKSCSLRVAGVSIKIKTSVWHSKLGMWIDIARLEQIYILHNVNFGIGS